MLQAPARVSVSATPDFLSGGAEMGRRIREADWSGETSLTIKVSPHATRGLAL